MPSGRASATILALALFLSTSLAAQAPEPTLVELRLGRVAHRTVPAFRIGDDALLPLGLFFELAEVRTTLDSLGRFTARLEPSGSVIAVAVGARLARRGSDTVSVAPHEVHFEGAELYLAASVLSRLLQAEIAVDWSTLEATLLDPSALPVAERARRERARARLGGLAPEGAALRTLAPSRGSWDGFVLDYSWFAPSSDLVAGSTLALAAGADVLGGSLEASVRSNGRLGDGNLDAEGSWLGVWRENRWLTQLRLGDGPGAGPRPRNLRGFSLTNAPYVRPSLLGSYAHTGRLPAGWQIEAYRGGQLVGLDSVLGDGSYALDVPILFGSNPVEFVAYGPFGERQTFTRAYRASSALVPAGTVEYTASAGACRLSPCAAVASADLRYGVSRRWTAQAGMERIWRDSLADLAHPYVSAMGSLTWAWTVQAEAVANALVRAGVAYEPTLNLRLGADVTRFDDDVEASLANPLDRRSQLRLAAFVRPDTRHDHIYFDATAEFATRENATSSRLHGAISAQVGGLRLQPYARHERDAVSGAATVSRTYGGLTLFLIPSGRVGPLLRNSWIRASAEAENFATPRLASFSVARPIARSLRIEAGVNWVRGGGGPAFTLTLASAFDALRTFTTVSAQSRTPAAVTQYVQGSVLYDRNTGITFDAGPSLQRSGVAGTVYLDVNGNGARDAGEDGLPNVRVQVGTGSALSDSTGAYRVWDIVPFEPVVVVPDSMSFESPLWVTTGEATAVLPAPNRFTLVDIPLSVGAVLEGKVTRPFGGTMQGVAGATLELTELRSGTKRRVTTFSDGAFYILGIPPGDYELRVGPRILEILRVTAAPWRFAISPDGAGPGSIEISLEPATD